MGSGYGIARAVEELISYGHDPKDVWRYTPRRLTAYLHLAVRRKVRERADELNYWATVSQGDTKSLRKLAKQLADQGQ